MPLDTYLKTLNQQRQPAAAQTQTQPPPPKSAPATVTPSPAPNLYDLFPGQQAMHNWTERAVNKYLAGAPDFFHAGLNSVTNPGAFTANLAALRAQRQQIEDQMSPAAKASADIFGGMASPLARLNPVAQGAAQQGLESAFRLDDPTTIAANTGLGGATGGAAMLASSPAFMSWAIKAAPSLFGLAHGGAMEGVAGRLIGEKFVDPAVDKLSEVAAGLPSWGSKLFQQGVLGGVSAAEDTPSGQQAVQNLKNAAPNMDWNTVQTALQNLRGMAPF